MSTTELYAVKQNGEVTLYDEVQNSYRGGMHVWNSLNEEYELDDNFFTQYETTWGKFNKGTYEPFEDIVLGSTFDFVLIKKENFGTLIESFKMYDKKYSNSSFMEQVKIIEEMQKDEDIQALAWCQTSVVNDMWLWDLHDGDDDDWEEDSVVPYNINKGDKHWFLFDSFDLTL